MGIISKPKNFTSGVIPASDVDADFDTLYTLVNGNIETVNIAEGTITDDNMNDSASIVTRWDESFQDYVVDGLTVTASGLACTVAGGIAYVSGDRITPSSTGHTVTANSTSYCDVGHDGTFSWNGNSTPATGYLRLAKIVAGASTCTISDLRNLTPVGENNISSGAVWDIGSTVLTSPASITSATIVTLLTVDLDSVENGDTLFMVLSGTFSQATNVTVVNLGFRCGGVAQTYEFAYDIEVVGKSKILTVAHLYPVVADAAPFEIIATVRTSAVTLTAASGTGLYVLRLRQGA